jgi:WD40 repeat protein
MKPFVVKKHTGLVWSLAFSPDGKTLASGGADNNVVIWDVPTGQDLMTFKHNGMVEALRFSPDGRLLASAAHEPSRGSVCLWRAPADEEAPGNTLRFPAGPAVLDQPAGSRERGAGGAPGAPASGSRVGEYAAGSSAAAPMPSSYSRPDDDRYNMAPPAAAPPSTLSPGPSAALQTGGAPPFNSGAPPTDGLSPPDGFSRPSGSQDNTSGGRPNTGRRPRPAS